MDPYRDNTRAAVTAPRDPRASQRAAKARLLKAGLAIMVAGLFLPTIARNCRTKATPRVPAELLDAGARFPTAPADLQPSVPLEPLLAADAPDRLAVLSPTGGAQNLRPGQPLVVRFNRPMVAGAAVGKPVDPSLLSFSDRTAGRATWTSRSTLTFEPARTTWDRSHPITWTLSPELRSLAGEAIEETLEQTVVFDNGPQLQGRATGSRLIAGEPVRLWFSGKVDPGALGPALMVYEVDGGKRMIPFSVATSPRDDRGRTRVDLALRAALEPGARFAVAVAPPLASGGASPRIVELELAPRPHIEGIACPAAATDASACAFQAPPGAIVDIGESLRLLSSEPLGALSRSSIVVTPPLDELRGAIEAEKMLHIEGAFAPGQVYEVRIEGLRDHEGHALARTPPLAVRSAGRTPEIRAREGRMTFERDAASALPIAGIHVEQGEARIVAVRPDEELAALTMPETLVADEARDRFATVPLPQLLPDARPNRWATGELAWPELARARSNMVVLALLPDAEAKKGATLPTRFIQQTDLGIDTMVLPRGVLTWVTSIATAMPIAGAEVTVADAHGNPIGLVTADDGGVAWLPIFDPSRIEREVIVRAARGDDRAVMIVDPRSSMSPRHFGVSPGAAATEASAVVATVFTDRGIVRPGESFHASTVVRSRTADGGLAAMPGDDVQISVFGPRNEAPVFERTTKLSLFGTADATFTLGADAPTGAYRVEARVGDPAARVGVATFTASDYRPPTFRIDLAAPTRDLVERDTLRLDVEAAYMFGPKAAGRPARFTITRHAFGDPEGWDEYTFGPVDAAASSGTMAAGELQLDAHGQAVVTAPVAIGTSVRAQAIVEVTVDDVSGLSTSARHTLPLYPADTEVGMREIPRWLEHGATLDVDAIVVAHDGRALSGRRVDARIVREGWHRYWEWAGSARHDDDESADGDGRFQARRTQRAEVVHRCELTSTEVPTRCRHAPERPGTYLIEVETRDDAGRVSTASQRVYLAGPDEHPDRDKPGAAIALSPKEDLLQVGDTAEIAFESPFPDAVALLQVHREGTFVHETRRVAAGGQIFRFAVTADMIPNAFVTLSLVRPRTGPPEAKIDLAAPDLRVGLAELTVRPAASPLVVSLQTVASAGAGSDVQVDVVVADDAGRGVESEVTLFAVDEGTLRVTGYATPEADAGFFPRTSPAFAWEDLRRSLVSRITEPLMPAAGGDGAGPGPSLRPEQLDRFEPTPLWVPHLVTDRAGRAHATLRLPERATRYRIMAVATDTGIRSGSAAESILATMPVVVRPVLPAQVTVGDRFEAVAFIHNAEPTPVEIEVTTTVGGVVRAPRTIRVEPEAEARVSEWIDVEREGVLAIGFATVGETGSTDTRSRLLVAPRARVVRSSVVGAVEDSRTVAVDFGKGGSGASAGPLTLAIAAHPFVGFETSLESLFASSVPGVEAMASRLIGLSAYTTLDTGKRPASVAAGELEARARQTVMALSALQGPSGGFGAFSANEAPDAYLTAFALHALSAASRAGFEVRTDVRLRARSFLAERVRGNDFLDGGGGAPGRGHDELAFALRVLSEEAEPDTERMGALYQQRDRLTPYGLAQLTLALGDDDYRRVTLAADALRVLFTRQDEKRRPDVLRWHDGSARTLGAVLEAASGIEAVVDATSELASRLLLARSAEVGGWASSHETSAALAALAAYARIFPGEDPIEATVWLDGARLEPTVATDTLLTYELTAGTVSPGTHALHIETAGLAWFALDGSTAVPLGPDDEIARGESVAIHRRFEDESGKPLPSGAHVKLGDLVRVRLFVFSEHGAPPYLAVRDHLAGGLEPVDGQLATSPRDALSALLGMSADDDVVDARAHHATRSLELVSHRTVAPGEAVFYLAGAGSGLHELTYGVRATTPGTFVVPPAEIEALYARSFLARSAMATLIVDP